MAETQLSHKLGTDNSIFNHDVPAKIDSSDFPIGRKSDFMLDAGMIVPIDLIETNPKETFELKNDFIIKTAPLVAAPFTNYKVRTHWYYCRLSDLWEGAETMITKGRSGNIEIEVPQMDTLSSDCKRTEDGDMHTYMYAQPMSLSAYLGIKPGVYRKNGANSTLEDNPCTQVVDFFNTDIMQNWVDRHHNWDKNILPFFMYQKIYRYAYLVPNLLQDNKIWFPDNLNNGWRINYAKTNFGTHQLATRGQFCPEENVSSKFNYDEQRFPVHNEVPTVHDTSVNITSLRYATFEDDRFTRALPWKTRGTAPTIDLNSDEGITITTTIPSIKIWAKDQNGNLTDLYSAFNQVEVNGSDDIKATQGIIYKESNDQLATGIITSRADRRSSDYGTGPITINQQIPALRTSFSINDLRSKIALTVWQERAARTQGDYNATIYAHFNHNPHSKDYEPIYIGGTSDVILFRDVVQTSETANTPQGTSTGIGETRGGGDIGFFESPDYGYIMGVMIIQPETIYATTVEKLWKRTQMEDFYMPEFQQLGLEEIYNWELMQDPTTNDNNELWGYNERGTEYKTRQNRALGFYALPEGVYTDITAQVQARNWEWGERPKLSLQFVTMSPENMRKDWLAVPTMPGFKCTHATICRARRAMAYKSIPQTFGF